MYTLMYTLMNTLEVWYDVQIIKAKIEQSFSIGLKNIQIVKENGDMNMEPSFP